MWRQAAATTTEAGKDKGAAAGSCRGWQDRRSMLMVQHGRQEGVEINVCAIDDGDEDKSLRLG